ncbi:MAG TPA: winged helix-turn-helix domain-containing protein [Usitatibacter sp.]|jgi:DNA-binding winged helix-turn-helix (wHTH) protein/tetratricopeptide (TPR) repeat protein|nr:winged helix-turn-helix domain-containing protein [Usitatibacter sp.]
MADSNASGAADRSIEDCEYEFGPFRLDAARRALYRGEAFVPLTPKAAEMLLLLVEQAGRVVTKEQLFERAWPGVVVEEGTLANNISALRKVLDAGFGGDGPIATVARRGYRFTAPVRSRSDKAAAPPSTRVSSEPARRDTVLIGDIENRTGDAVFDGTLRQALLLHLAQSPFLEIVPDRKVRSALQAMQRPLETPVTGDEALEIAQRTGAGASITGSIHVLGDDYVIGITALAPETGEILVAEQARAHGKAEVLKALDGAALDLRGKLGESLASVSRYSSSFDEVATASLEALKAYTIGRREWMHRGDAAVISHQLRAIELDPGFASAHSLLGIAFSNMGQTLRAKEHITRAYELRDRASERERQRIEANYHHMVRGDLHRALDAYLMTMRAYPRDDAQRSNTANGYMMLGQWEAAFTVAEHAEATSTDFSNLAIIQMALGRHDDARRTLDTAFARNIDAFYLRLDAYQEAFLRGDDEAMRRHFDAVAGRPGEEDFLIAGQADTEAYLGRVERARELTRRAADSALRAGSEETSAAWLAEGALREAEMGFPEHAVAWANAALERSPGRDVRCLSAYALARSGAAGTGESIVAALERDHPEDTLVQRYWLPCVRAALALAAGDAAQAVRLLEPAESIELGISVPFESGFVVPAYLRGLALRAGERNAEAAREFAKIVSRPGLLKNFVIHPLAVKASLSLGRGPD